MTTVLVVEDDQTMAEMVAYNLRRQGLEVDVCADGQEGLRRARADGIAMVILDLMLPSVDGIQIAREVRRDRPALPILMLTARAEEHVKLQGFEAGADDYLTKPFSMDELVARVKALLRRGSAPPRDAAEQDRLAFGDLSIAVRDMRCWIGDEEIQLRPKELKLLATMAAEPGRLFTRPELGRLVWGYSFLGDTRTIDTHVKNIRRKVQERSAYRYIETVRGAGYRFRVRPRDAAS